MFDCLHYRVGEKQSTFPYIIYSQEYLQTARRNCAVRAIYYCLTYSIHATDICQACKRFTISYTFYASEFDFTLIRM